MMVFQQSRFLREEKKEYLLNLSKRLERKYREVEYLKVVAEKSGQKKDLVLAETPRGKKQSLQCPQEGQIKREKRGGGLRGAKGSIFLWALRRMARPFSEEGGKRGKGISGRAPDRNRKLQASKGQIDSPSCF